MVEKTTYSMRFRRRTEGKTDYRKRLALVKSGKPRLAVRVRGKSVVVQLIRYEPKGDAILASATSANLKKLGFKGHGGNTESAYLAGYLCGKKALDGGFKEAVLDIGLHTPVNGTTVFASLKGALDAGMNIPHDEKCFPAEEKLVTERGRPILEKMKG